MGSNIEHYLNAQHCLAIAAGFIAIIAACAALIASANNKAEYLSKRICEIMKEHREVGQKSDRCTQIEMQVELFNSRFRGVQQSQRLLFITIGLFILSLMVFIAIGLYIMYEKLPDEQAYVIARSPLLFIAGCVIFGSGAMVAAIVYQFLEIGKSYKSFCIETSDCPPPDRQEAQLIESASMAKGAAG